MKRYTQLPQVVLGAAFSWAIPMAYMASIGSVPLEAWLYLPRILFGLWLMTLCMPWLIEMMI